MLNPYLEENLAAARNGDQEAFQQLTDPYRRELLAHCYRMLGSFEDAEDILQETLLRAWRRLDSFEGRAPLRAWLYRIATYAGLDALDRRKARGLPSRMTPPSDPQAALPAPATEIAWLEPFPDALIDPQPAADPEARYDAHESVKLAFLTVLQTLPGRQRAVLLLRDVLGWSAGETGETLGMTTAAVNSALQRARATLERADTERLRLDSSSAGDENTASLLAKYMHAWEAADSGALVALLRRDATLTMPPVPAWYRGQADIQAFLQAHLFTWIRPGDLRLHPTKANASPAFAVYQVDPASGEYLPAALHVLTLQDGLIAQIDDFLCFDNRLFSRFGLPISG